MATPAKLLYLLIPCLQLLVDLRGAMPHTYQIQPRSRKGGSRSVCGGGGGGGCCDWYRSRNRGDASDKGRGNVKRLVLCKVQAFGGVDSCKVRKCGNEGP
jgi:hypothetical protein